MAIEFGIKDRAVGSDTHVVSVSGEVDLFNADAFGRGLATAANGVSSMRLRTSRLRFIAVAGNMSSSAMVVVISP